ncbi:Asp23/Gls24 family envelope stress response protein [Curtobacterium flaccumfaciens]|uniref:Asp23/Gls24 family envelope stress response protein n=1 Tax=Curtobacterium flaccumfaciens TaxID=2035 RepID=UPI0013E91567|nr:Asp23/Gls24 family envelope stress response protein [Curtobacterium flaccumfaciens]MCS0644471.1 Asp23/Gls24 family envelope stress response protein [Curtobacterium flaccumfaciens pv. flaccumfaciens]MCS6525280.1 Asp23/Gls24 family envelope stress response protein [Curtobacterium flaccumfaciens pv. flaccumfaciens]MCS6530673.1 Asp23/Gls24 family envelope stress response protein [Curtobacterium flaccumfaciens pv. flaccumfaciens]NUU09640.1 Asp23/Gls24 family envelope stress response protein [Curt
MQHDPHANTQVTEVALPAALTEPLPDDASTATIVARTAAETALGVPGVHHLGGIAARAADQLRKQLGRSAGTAGVQVDEEDGVLAVQVAVVVSYPHPVLDVAAEVRQQVTAATRQLSDLRTSVDVRVLDVHGPFDDEQSPLGRAAEQATDAVKQAAESTGEAVKQAAETTADATKRAATATADATKQAASATADATKQAADATADTTKRAVDAAAETGERLRDAASESLARASEQAADAASSAKDAAEQARDVVVDAAGTTRDRASDAADAAADAADDAAVAADAAADAAAAPRHRDQP